MEFFTLEADRLLLINCNIALYDAIESGDAAIRDLLNINTPAQWNEFGRDIFGYSRNNVLTHPEWMHWWSYLIVLKSENMLIGDGGYKGPPDANGMVEIGYEIGPEYRERGFATEAASALIRFAFSQPEVRKVWAHTLAEPNASVRVLEKCGMIFAGKIHDPQDGDVWRWEILKSV